MASFIMSNGAWNTIQAFINHPVSGFAFGLFLLVVSYRMNAYGSNLVLTASWVCFVYAVFRTLPDQPILPKALWTSLVASALGIAMYCVLWTRPKVIAEEQTLKPIPPVENAAGPDLTPKSIYDLFTSDFSRLGDIQSDLTLHHKDGSKLEGVKALWFQDFESRSEFVSIYVPSGLDTYEVCRSIPGVFNKILNIFHSSMVTEQKDPADSHREKSAELVFTGKVYIYYEGDLSHEQIGVLESIFKSKNLSPQFRGKDYATVRWLQSRFK